MAPVLIVPLQIADKGNRHPTVNEYGVQQHVKPGFKRRIDFGQYDKRENILPDRDNGPYFTRQHRI
jgi:hypothetical protein